MGLASPALLFGVRLWGSVCLALFIAFALGLDDAYRGGMSAAVVCPSASGRLCTKAISAWWAVVGAVAAVILSMLFAQERLWFLLALAVSGGACGVASRMLRHFASLPLERSQREAAAVQGAVPPGRRSLTPPASGVPTGRDCSDAAWWAPGPC